jgi:hypothetical protein
MGKIMSNSNKLDKLLKTQRGPGEIQDWLFSLAPIGVAFTFYIVFIMSSDIEPKSIFLAYGAAAGFIGLESYWIVRGWRKNNISTIIMGITGNFMTLGILWLYLTYR